MMKDWDLTGRSSFRSTLDGEHCGLRGNDCWFHGKHLVGMHGIGTQCGKTRCIEKPVKLIQHDSIRKYVMPAELFIASISVSFQIEK